MAGRPFLLDNLAENATHGDGLSYLVGDLQKSHQMSVATGYVNLRGLHHLAVVASDGRRVRLLLGAAPDPGLSSELPIRRFEKARFALVQDRDLARFPPSRAARQLTDLQHWLEKTEVQIRRYTTQFLHGKAYLFGDQSDSRAALVTSANLTGGGLFNNLELGLVNYNPPVAESAIAWFDSLWEQSSDYKAELQELLFPDPGLVDPQTVYLRALLELYEAELDPMDGVVSETVRLAPFQRDGFNRALRIVERHNGVIYADGVGTGKTEIGLAFIEEYALRRGHHALVVAPAQLVEYWRERINRSRLPAQVISYQGFATDEQLTADGGKRRLHNNKDAYRLVLFDEGHALRSPGTTWYRALTQMLGGEQKDLVLLTATPINNGLWDMFHLVMTFARHDRAFADRNIRSLRSLFIRAGANERDPENLNPDVLFPLADMVSVRRDRRFIEERYPGATFPDGTPVRFPEPTLRTKRYDLDQVYPGLVREITGAIDRLTMARYRPSAYQWGEEESVSEAALAGLLRSAILKRFESCWEACLHTVQRMLTAHDAFLHAWDNGVVPGRDSLLEITRDGMDEVGIAEWLTETLDSREPRPIQEFRAEYHDDVASDRELLRGIEKRLSRLDPSDDPKLALLRRLIEESPSEKVVVFATFVDTIRYIDHHLPERVGGRERVTVVGEDTDPDQRTALLSRFCPKTVVHSDYTPPGGEVDLLLSNDVLSEGQNLQQAGAVISYDMPWNPQRVVQRNGRVIRLLSHHEQVFLTTMLPEPGDLEDMLELEVAIQRKMVAAQPYGMETEVIEGIEHEVRTFAQRLAEGDFTLLDETDTTDSMHAFSGETLREELRRALQEGEIARLHNLPWGIGAAFRQGPGVPSRGAKGVFFACRTRSDERYWRYVTEKDITSEPAVILRSINPGPAPEADAPKIDLEIAWSRAVSDIIREHNELADLPVEEPVGPIQSWALAVLRDPTVPLPTGAEEAAEALRVGRANPVRTALANVRRDLRSGAISSAQAAIRIVEVVKSYGLRPVDPLPRLTPITEDDVGVVCWMAVLREPG